jgi:hypothetical protein
MSGCMFMELRISGRLVRSWNRKSLRYLPGRLEIHEAGAWKRSQLSPFVNYFDSQCTIESQARVSGALLLLKSTMLNINKYNRKT